MSFTDYLNGIGNRDMLPFAAPEQYQVVDIQINDAGQVSSKQSKIECHNLLAWAKDQRANIGHEKHSGRLLIVLHEWDPRAESKSPMSNNNVPFKDAAMLDGFLDAFALSRTFSYDFGRKQYLPMSLSMRQDGLTLVSQTQNFPAFFTTLALSYDVARKTNFCFLGLTKGQMGELHFLLKQLGRYTDQPLLLVVLLYVVTGSMLRRSLNEVRTQMDSVQKNTGLLGRIYRKKAQEKAKDGQPSSDLHAPNYEALHQTLVQQHFELTRGQADFVRDLDRSLDDGISKIRASSMFEISIDHGKFEELYAFVQRVRLGVNNEMHNRERLLSRVDMQLQVLYNLMQQRIADETKKDTVVMEAIALETLRDSSSMKSIAALTMVFLPATALATIFSMGPFFTTNGDGSKLIVSSRFWIFLAVSIPLTIVVVVVWVLFTQRREAQAYWKQHRPRWTRKQGQAPADSDVTDIEKGQPSTPEISPSGRASPIPARSSLMEATLSADPLRLKIPRLSLTKPQ